ncbi:MAG: C2H2-type zinc finger protein [Candidatus Nitrosotalea sp.]|nr:C2H2-type zinc finger protein [Candidatus Nitrosotalea sp.]
MITVDCRDIPSLKSPLAVYTSDQVGAVPALKIREFVLDSISDDGVDAARVIKAIRNFLDSLSIEKHFAIIQNKNLISVVAIDDFKLEMQPAQLTDQFFSCVHCGHVTQFEAVHNNHMKIHYL